MAINLEKRLMILNIAEKEKEEIKKSLNKSTVYLQKTSINYQQILQSKIIQYQ